MSICVRSTKGPYRGNQFWSTGHCADTVSLDSVTIRKYAEYKGSKNENREAKETLLRNQGQFNLDGLAKSRHPGENRGPEGF
ncbi:hypothetical protein ACFL0Q_06875 [Thermodesulfobacteriota bacterium]